MLKPIHKHLLLALLEVTVEIFKHVQIRILLELLQRILVPSNVSKLFATIKHLFINKTVQVKILQYESL